MMMDAKAQLQAEADEWERTIATSADSSVRSTRTGECRRMVTARAGSSVRSGAGCRSLGETARRVGGSGEKRLR